MKLWDQLDKILRLRGKLNDLRCDGFGMGTDGKPVVLSSEGGFLTKTVAAREPKKNERRCTICGGDGWDADCGGVFVCPECNGTGVIPNG